MTRKLIAVLAAAVLPAVFLAPPAHAVDTTVQVFGHDGVADRNDLLPWSNACGQPEFTGNTTKLVRAGGALGSTAIGYDFTGPGDEAGVLAWRSDNTTLTEVRTSVHADVFDGHAIALYDYWNSGFVGGYYVGVANKFQFDFDNDWGQIWHTGTYSWYLVDENFDVVPDSQKTSTIANMRNWQGAGGGVWAGFVMGCNSNAFYVDRLRLTHGADTTTYDLETNQIQSMAHIEYSPDGKRVRNGNVTIKYGKRLRILGHAHGHHDSVYFQAQGALWAQPFGKSWRRVATGSFDPDYYASFAQRPAHRTVYYFTTGADTIHTAANSEYMVVNVRARASIKILDRTLVEGQRITALGRIKPGNRGQKLKLQRRINGTWKTFASGRTNRRGEYRFSGVASSPGTWKVRVLVESGNGNLGTKTAARYVTVKKYVPPPPKKGDGEAYTPPVYVPDEPAPSAPDPVRGTDSGRVVAREATVRVGQAPPAG